MGEGGLPKRSESHDGPGCGGRGVLPEGGAGTGESGLGRHGGPGPPALGLVTSAATRQSPWSSATTMLASL